MIEHRYRPSVGASVQTSLGSPEAAKEAWYEEYKLRYCMDRPFLAAIERARVAAKSQSGAPFAEERIDYILKTGANWSGPIRQFRLVVDKGDADSLVSFCGADVKRIGDTQFEMRKSDYTPDPQSSDPDPQEAQAIVEGGSSRRGSSVQPNAPWSTIMTPKATKSRRVAAIEPPTSIPRQASSTTTTSKPSCLASSHE